MNIPKIPKKYRPKGFDILYEDRDLIIGNKSRRLFNGGRSLGKRKHHSRDPEFVHSKRQRALAKIDLCCVFDNSHRARKIREDGILCDQRGQTSEFAKNQFTHR